MPAYDMVCTNCGEEFEAEAPIKVGPPDYHFCRTGADSQTGKLVQRIHAPVIHGLGGLGARKLHESERERDMAAYTRLRRDGVQPSEVKGAAELETRAGTPTEVERNMVFEDRKLANKFESVGADLKAEGAI